MAGHAVKVEKLDADYWIEWNLKNWAAYMRSDELPQGCPTKASGGVKNYTSMDLDNIATYESLDRGLAEATGAAIDDLSPVESCAIYHRYLHAVFRFQRETLDEALVRAKANLKPLLRMRHVWLGEQC